MVKVDDANNNTADSSSASTNNLSSTVPNNNDRSNDAKNAAPGGLLGYFINRKIAGASDNSMMQPLIKNATSSDASQGPPRKQQRKASRSTTLRMHEMVNAGGSAYFGSVVLDADSDSDDENNALQQQPLNSNPTVAKSWLASYQTKQSLPLPSLKEDANPAESASSSWMSQALQTVDSAKEWISSSPSPNKSSNAQQPIESTTSPNSTNSWTVTVSSSVANALSNTMATVSSLNPFTDPSNNNSQQTNNNDPDSSSSTSLDKNTSSSSAFLPKFASNFDWAMKQRNPYQAVVGRDADLLLSSPSNTWNNLLYSWTTWLPINWITTATTNNTNTKQSMIEDRYGGSNKGSSSAAAEQHGEILQLAMRRRKSQPSEASVQAVKNLLLLVQQQVVEEEGQRDDPEQQHGAASSSTTIIPQQGVVSSPHPSSLPTSPKLMPIASPTLPSLSTPNPLLMTPIPSLKEEGGGEDGTTSFDSEPSYDPSLQSSPARASPTPAEYPSTRTTTTINNEERDTAHVFSPVSRRRAKRSTHIHGDDSDHNLNDNDVDCNKSKNNSNNNNIPQPSPSSPTNHQAMHAEMAARLAEGTLRAYRDLALDEATELHSALHHWTIRWERPLLGWLEAGPTVWFSENGYSPHMAGKKVSQLQAVLARRCAVIGELQQHLWRANWRKGVAEWGMLGGGIGGEWASVVGELGGIEAPSSSGNVSSSTTQLKIFNHSSFIGTNVSNKPGGGIIVDQDGMTRWSIDAMRVIRDQLYRALPASQSQQELPFVSHWPAERKHFGSEDGNNDDLTTPDNDLPTWAHDLSTPNSRLSNVSRTAAAAVGGRNNSLNNDSMVTIKNLNTMANEVSALLQSIEIHLEQQRVRRLNRLRPLSRLRRRWYFIALGIPVGSWVLYKLLKRHGGIYIMNKLMSKAADIYRDHVSEPINSIYQELFTPSGRLDVTDRKARIDAIDSLKRMIRSWLDEMFPEMPVEEKIERAETMDISLIEEKMEESIKHIYELNSVVRMSLIEMQFIKKELLSALVSMDELMGSNEINMQIAAMTPAVILLVAIRRGFRLLFYAVFQVGKSKEEIYTQFRQTILDIERLLLMRDNPPPPPDALDWGSSRSSTNNGAEALAESNIQNQNPQTLSAEDLGMVLLHIHECRNILWQSRRRFRSDILRNVAEDLAELAGERGPVSVSQQLQIIARMSRTYPFMKVVSSSVPFEMIIPITG